MRFTCSVDARVLCGDRFGEDDSAYLVLRWEDDVNDPPPRPERFERHRAPHERHVQTPNRVRSTMLIGRSGESLV